MEATINKEFVFNHFARKTSPLQRELIARWLQEKANEEQYYEWLEEWENEHRQYSAPLDMASQRYARFLAENPEEKPQSAVTLSMSERRHWWQTGWFVAASALLIGCLTAFLRSDVFLYETYETTFGETRSLKLTDGSTVLLNANSTLHVPRWGFGQNTREVRLTGEADFSVAHTPSNQRFVVKTDKHFDVVVVGTEFTVFARKRGAHVALHKGKVQLQYQEGHTAKQLMMKPGQLATLNPNNHLALKETKAVLTPPFGGQKRFVFNEVSLQEVAYMLEENYGLRVELKDHELASRVLVGSVRADNVDQLLQSISEILDINVVHQGNRVQLQSH